MVGMGVSPWGASPLDGGMKEGSGFYGFSGFNGVGAAHKNIEAPRVFDQQYSRIGIPTEAEEPFSLAV